MIVNKSLLIDVANLISPSGYETQFIEFVDVFCKKHCSNLKVVHNNGSLFIVYLANPSAKTILFDAHIDQVSCRIFKITDDGFLYVRCFGTNPKDLAGKPVKVITSSGDIIPGIITIYPPHLDIHQDESDNIIIDIFMNSYKQASKYVSIGDAIVFDSPAKIMNTDYLVGAGLDNHVGAYCLLETAKYLSNNAKKLDLKYNVVFHLSRREETSGLKFIEMFRNEPDCPKSVDLVIVVDTDIATDIPSIDKSKFPLIQLSNGPILTRNIIDDDKVYRYICSIAGKIPYQVSMSEGDGGNNLTDYAKLMIYGQFVGIPLRYMHSSVETCFLPDIEKTINLLIAIYSNLNTFFSSK
jgi:putative aminopeptidase FrvX